MLNSQEKMSKLFEILQNYTKLHDDVCWKILSYVMRPETAAAKNFWQVFLYDEFYCQKKAYYGNLWDLAAKHGNLRVLQELEKHSVPAIHDESLERAVFHGHWDCFLWLLDHGRQITKKTMDWAAAGGQLEIVKWLAERGHDCTNRALESAIGNKHYDVAAWLHENGKDCTSEAMDCAIRNQNMEWIEILTQKKRPCSGTGTYIAASSGNLDLVTYLWNHSMPFGNSAIDGAVVKGHREIANFLYQKGLRATIFAMNTTAKQGNMEMVQWLFETGHTFSEKDILYASQNGHVDVIDYLLCQGITIPFDINECFRVASYMGHLPVIEYLMDFVRYDADDLTRKLFERNQRLHVKKIIQGGHLPILQYYEKETGYIPSLEDMAYAVKYGKKDIFSYYENFLKGELGYAIKECLAKNQEDFLESVKRKYLH